MMVGRRVMGGNVGERAKPPLGWRGRLLYHLVTSVLLFAVAMMGFLVNAPGGDLRGMFVASAVITGWLNIVVAIVLMRRR